MTLKELSQLYYLKREIEIDRQRLAELRLEAQSPSSPNITGMPKGTSTESTLERKCERVLRLDAIISAKIARCEREMERLENYIADIPDSLTRQIFTLRFIRGYTWQQVANRCGGYNTANTVKKRCYRYALSKSRYKNVTKND